MFPQPVIGAIEIYSKYITRDCLKITPHDFLETRLVINFGIKIQSYIWII